MNVLDKVIIIDKQDTVYEIIKIKQDMALIKGCFKRIIRWIKLDDLIKADQRLIEKEEKQTNYFKDKLIKTKTRNKNKVLFGTILHIDGDKNYLNSCIELYKEMNITSWGLHLDEKEIKNKIVDAINQVTPDIVVITGHDFYNGEGIKDVNNYYNSKDFYSSIREVRKHFDKDSLIIIAGACTSHFEALIAAGANFASSPKRINIHTYDPAVIAVKCATTSCNQNINFNDCLKFIENGKDAYGGIETKGKMRMLL